MNITLFFNDQSLPAPSYDIGCDLLIEMAKSLSTLLDMLNKWSSSDDNGEDIPVDEIEDIGELDGEEMVLEDDDEEDDITREWISGIGFEYYILSDTDIIRKALSDKNLMRGDGRDAIYFLNKLESMSPVLENVSEHWRDILRDADCYHGGVLQKNWETVAAAAVESGVLASLGTHSPWNQFSVPIEIVWLSEEQKSHNTEVLNLSRFDHVVPVYDKIVERASVVSISNWHQLLPGVQCDPRVKKWLEELERFQPQLFRRIIGNMCKAHRRKYRPDGVLVKTIVTNENEPVLFEVRVKHCKNLVRVFFSTGDQENKPIYLFGGVKPAQKKQQTGWYSRAKKACKSRLELAQFC